MDVGVWNIWTPFGVCVIHFVPNILVQGVSADPEIHFDNCNFNKENTNFFHST